ncbi:MAG: GAF domain-containing protein [bacterium]
MGLFKRKNGNNSNMNQDNSLESIIGINTPEKGTIDITQSFSNLTDELNNEIEINKGVLVIRMQDTNELAAISTWNNGVLRDGLRVTLPGKSSLFEKVAEDGSVYTEDFCSSFSGNFFERKLLLDDNSRSFMVFPLKTEGKVVGILAYSSEEPIAFAVFEEGKFRNRAEKFATEIHSLITQL